MERTGNKEVSCLLEHVDIETNHRCNLACKHCSAKAVHCVSPGEMSTDEIKRVLAEAKSLGLRKVGLTGGEPLCDLEKLRAVAEFCVHELDVPLHTHTNGTLVNGGVIENGSDLRLFDAISVTFLAGSAEAHDYMTGKRGSFEGAFEGARVLASAGLPLTCYFVPTHGTCDGFNQLVPKLREIGVQRIRAMALAPSGRARPIYGETAPLPDEIEAFEESLLKHGDEFDIQVEAGYCTRLTMPGLAVLNGHEECMSGINRVHINFKGDVFPCTAASGVQELCLGNVRNREGGLSEIWLSSELLKRIRMAHSGLLEACRSCQQEPKCRFGCMVNTIGTMTHEARSTCPLTNLDLAAATRLTPSP